MTQRKDELLALQVHGNTAGRLVAEPAGQFGKEFDARRPRVGHDAPAGGPENQQIVGQEAMARVQETGCQAGFPETAIAKEDGGFSVDYDGGGVERLKTLLHQRVRKRLAQQVNLERLLMGLVILAAGDLAAVGGNQKLSHTLPTDVG